MLCSQEKDKSIRNFIMKVSSSANRFIIRYNCADSVINCGPSVK